MGVRFIMNLHPSLDPSPHSSPHIYTFSHLRKYGIWGLDLLWFTTISTPVIPPVSTHWYIFTFKEVWHLGFMIFQPSPHRSSHSSPHIYTLSHLRKCGIWGLDLLWFYIRPHTGHHTRHHTFHIYVSVKFGFRFLLLTSLADGWLSHTSPRDRADASAGSNDTSSFHTNKWKHGWGRQFKLGHRHRLSASVGGRQTVVDTPTVIVRRRRHRFVTS